MNHSIPIIALISLSLLTSCANNNNSSSLSEYEWIDLSHAYDSQTPYWPTASGFKMDTVFYGMTDKNFFYSAFSFSSAEHGGTHIDAPIHFAANRKTVDQIKLDQLIGPGVLIDVSKQSAADIDYLITVEDITNWEKINGELTRECILFFRTGYGRFWPNKKLYMGTDRTGPSAVALLHFPGLSPEAAKYLVHERSVKAVGIDTPSIDFGRSSEFMTHRILMEDNIPAFENMANLDKLPEQGFHVIALPMKIKGGSGGPLRVIAGILK
jgi:kynurenine formamidase